MEENRIITLYDKKAQIIDFEDSEFLPPDVGIYEGECRYYRANVAWASFIEGHLLTLATVAAWKDAEDESYFAIRQILKFIQGVEPMSIDYDAWKTANKEAIYEALNDLAKQIVSGRTTDIAVGSDGTVSDPTSGATDEPLPEDDPATAIDENKAARFGGSLGISAGINQFLAKLNTLYGVDATADTTIADATFLIQFLYVTENTMPASMQVYWDARAQGQAQITALDREDLANAVYCNKFVDFNVAVTQFIAGLTGYSVEVKNIAIDLVNGLEETQFKIWYNTGSAAASSEYIDAPCEPSPTEILLMPVLGTSYTTQTNWKAGHRLLFTVENYALDGVDGDIRDFWWYKTTAGSPSSQIANTNIQLGTGVLKPTTAQVPYSSTHKYVFTIDTGSAGTCQITISAASMSSITYPAGSIKVTIQDLGKIV